MVYEGEPFFGQDRFDMLVWRTEAARRFRAASGFWDVLILLLADHRSVVELQPARGKDPHPPRVISTLSG